MFKKTTGPASSSPSYRRPTSSGFRSPAPSRPSQPNTPSPTSSTAPEASTPSHSAHTQSRNKLRVMALGGLQEVGANMYVYEYNDDMIIVDIGFMFPDETTPGIDYIIPNTAYVEANKHKIRGVFLTHGHLDHIGALPYILPKLGNPPMYTLPLTAQMIYKRMEEFNLQNRIKISVISRDDVIPAGQMTVRFFGVNHNIPDSMGLSILTPVGQVVHTGDWKIDHTPINEKPAEMDKVAKFGGEGVALLVSDSTNALKNGYCISEKDLGGTIDSIFRNAEGRIIFASFSSLIPRIQQVFDNALKYDRKVVVTGRSIVQNIEIALSMAYLKIEPKLIIKSEQARNYPDNRLIFLTTGGQGEESSALARMARGEHKSVTLKKGDTAVLSASTIPGNERAVSVVLDNLTRLGCNVIYNKMLDIHTSGHAQQEELKLMMGLTKPKYFMPMHGEHHMLTTHANVAKSIGITEDRIFVMENGAVLEIDEAGKAEVASKVEAGYVYVDGLGVGDVGEVVIRDRRTMADDGMFVIIVSLDRRNGKIIGQPEIVSRGFMYMKGGDDLTREVKHEVRKLCESKSKDNLEPNWAFLRNLVRDEVGEYLYKKTERRPLVLPVILEI